jgi:hypothetical protein
MIDLLLELVARYAHSACDKPRMDPKAWIHNTWITLRELNLKIPIRWMDSALDKRADLALASGFEHGIQSFKEPVIR